MALSHTLGCPRIGRDPELKKALEAYWQLHKEAGIQLLAVGDFAWYDQVLTHSLSGAAYCG